MVISWILNLVSKEISTSIIFMSLHSKIELTFITVSNKAMIKEYFKLEDTLLTMYITKIM